MTVHYIHGHRLHLLITSVGLIVALMWAAIVILRPLPPRTVTMVTGPEGGAYYEFGKRYREILAREGIELRLQPTAGALENLARLRDPRSGVSVGMLQGGITGEKDSPDLVSLGTVSYEPLWFFRRDATLHHGAILSRGMEGLQGRRISVGQEGSGTRTLSLELLARNGIDQRFAELLALTPRHAGEKLLRGEVDAIFIIASWESPVVRQLLADENIDLMGFPRADAYVAHYPFLSKVIVPQGVGDLARNRPPADVVMVAPKASLVVREDLHPAIQYLLLDAATRIHSGPGIFQKPGQFPAAESIDLPLSDEASQFYKTGRPFLMRYLPFWVAVFLGRLLLLLIPVVGLLYPMLRFVPALYAWRMRRRIYRLYGELRFIEHALEDRNIRQGVSEVVQQLDLLEEKANRLKVPLFCANLLYILRSHIAMVRERLERLQKQ